MAQSIYVPQIGGFIDFKDEATDAEITAYLKSKFPAAPAPPPPAPPEEAVGALESGFYGSLGRLGTAGGSVAQAAGLDELSKYLFEQAKRNQEYAAKYKPDVADVSEIEGLGDVASFAGSTIAQSAPETAVGIGGAYAGAAAGAAVGSVVPGIGTAVGGLAGGIIGGAIATLPFFVGGNLQRQAIEKGLPIEDTDLASASVGAVVQAPLDTAFDVLIARKLPGGSAALDVARRGFLKEVARTAGQGAVTEALTEPAQQAIELAQANPEKLLDFGPDVQFEILNSAAAGALAGAGIGGAAGGFESTVTRRIAERPARQLQEDLSREAASNAQALRQGEISFGAEELRKANVSGDLEITEEEYDGLPRYVIKTAAGNSYGSFLDPAEAEEAVNIYKQRTDANVTIRKAADLPSVFPVKIGGKKYESTDDIIAARDDLVSKSEGLAAYMSRPDVIKREAARQNVSEDLVRRAVDEEVGDLNDKISKLNQFIAAAKPTPDPTLGQGDARARALAEGAARSRVTKEPEPSLTAGKLNTIPYDTLSWDDKQKRAVKSSGENDIIDIGGRKVVVKNVNGVNVPFYLSTGSGGKKNVPAGKWYPFFGIGPTDGWINKTGGTEMASYYGSPELEAAAVELDQSIGDIRSDNSIPKASLSGAHVDFINAGLDPSDNQTAETKTKVRKNIDRIKALVRAGKDQAVEQRAAVSEEAPIGFVSPVEETVSVSETPQKTEEAGPSAEQTEEAPVTQRTLSQAEAEGPVVRDYTPETAQKFADIYTSLKSRLSTLNLKDVDVKLEELIGTDKNLLIRGQARTEKTPNGIKSIVDLSTGILRPDMTVEQAVRELVETLNHEVIHVLRDQGVLRPSEWAILSKAASSAKVPGRKYTYLDKAQAIYAPGGQPISPVYAGPDAVIEEAVADMYRDWVKNQKAPQQTRGLFNRITEFFRRIFRVLKSSRYEGVFKAIESGEVGAREGVGRDEGTRFSAAPAISSDEFKQWFKKSKVAEPDGTPRIMYHGTNARVRFTTFDTFGSELGSHFGTQKQASKFVTVDEAQGEYRSGGRIYPVYLSIQNPLRLRDMGNWDNDKVASQLFDLGIIDRDMNDAMVPDFNLRTDKFNERERKNREILQKIIRDAGYDGIVYLNRFEGLNSDPEETISATYGDDRDLNELTDVEFKGYLPEAQDSYIVLRPTQVKSIFNKFEPGESRRLRFSAAPLPPYVEAKNRTLFVPEQKRSFFKDMADFFLGPSTQGKTLNTVYGQVDLKGGFFGTRAALGRRMSIVDQDAYIEWLEKVANEKDTGNFQRREATQSAVAALGWARRSSQLTASSVMMGAPSIEFSRPGDIQSATVAVRQDADNLMAVFRTMLEPGPVDSVTGEQADKRTIFKTYATAKRAIGLKAAGKPVPRELDDTYINTTISFTQQNYPEIVDAYNAYQRFNKKLITAARDAGYISDQELARFTQQMDYYGFYREIYEEPLVPGMPTKLAGQIKIREYRGSERGDLIEDPMLVMITNLNFWMGAITRNIATNKAFKLARDMGEARLLGASEKPDQSQGESEQVMFFREGGVIKRFAVKDPMLVASLGADDRIDMGGAMKLLSAPTGILRETITRDPAFMVANLIRDTLSSWITSGEDITPFVGTVAGFAKALKGTASYQSLVGRGVVGSHDLAMKSPAEMADTIRRRALPNNILNVASIDGAQGMIMSLWDRLGVWSEASDAATRIAVYESAIAQGMSEAEAAFRAIEIMNFNRRGASSLLNMFTKLVPFLNARIQGLDVLYQAGKAGIKTAAGRQLGERDAQLGKKFLVRGAILAAISIGIEMMLEDDEDYKDLPDYVKNGNLLIPLKWFGIEGGYFAAIAKPFEAGLIFSTIPQEIYKATTGETSGREVAKLFFSEFVSTFGVNPIPQVALPVLESLVNYDFYTDLPLISEGKARLAPELQYDSRTSTVAMILGEIPIKYNFTTGRFEGISPIIIDQLISGYGGPLGTYLMQGVGMAMEGLDVGPERLPKDITQLPVVKRFLLDAESRNPKSVAQAYELFRVVDEANRSFSRLRQTGDVEATMDYLEKNRDILSYKNYVYRLFDGLNKISAQERRIERDETMTREEKVEAIKRLREVRARLTSQISTINKAIGR